MKQIVSFVLALFLLLSAVVPVLAVTLSIDNYPPSISDQPFDIAVTVTGASAGQNYLRVDLYKEGTTNYFGETFTGNEWYAGSSGTLYFPITIPDSQTPVSASLQVRVGVPTVIDYPGPGEYKLKLRRYTASGNAASNDQQTPVSLQIVLSPTPTLTPTSSPTPFPSPTATAPTSTKTPTPTKVPTPTKTPTPTKDSVATPTLIISKQSVLGTKVTSSPTISHGSMPTAVLAKKEIIVSPTPVRNASISITPSGGGMPALSPGHFFIVGGVLILGSSGVLFYRNYRKTSIE